MERYEKYEIEGIIDLVCEKVIQQIECKVCDPVGI